MKAIETQALASGASASEGPLCLPVLDVCRMQTKQEKEQS